MNVPPTFSFVMFGLTTLAAIAVALGLGKVIGKFTGKKVGAAAQKAKDEIDRVKSDAKAGNDAAVLDDFRRSLGQKEKDQPQVPKHPLDRDSRPSK